MREVVAEREGWDAASRSLAMDDRTRMLRSRRVRWLLVLHEPLSLRVVGEDGAVIAETAMEEDVDQPIYRALLAVSGGPGSS